MDQMEQHNLQLDSNDDDYNNSNDNSNHDSDSDSSHDSSIGADLEAPPSPKLLEALEPSKTSILKHSIGARIQAITFLELGLPHFQITAKTGISKAQIYKLREKALSRGWNPIISRIIEVHHVEDGSCSGRPRLAQNAIDLILEIVTRNSTTRG
jgi:hypothetical protein